ncbi:MAG: AMP-binding protein [Pseudomonadota bacterium]
MNLTATDLLPMVTDLVRDELARLRNSSPLDMDSRRWTSDTLIGGEVIDADSIELIHLVTACAERFGLEELDAGDYLLRQRTLGEWSELAATGLERTGALTFRTSGSTGEPRPHRHRLDDLEQEVSALAELLPGTRRIVALVPSHHIYGCLMTILLPKVLNCPVVHDRDGSGRPPTDLAAGDRLIGFPLRWRQLLAGRPSLPTGVEAVTSTAPCPTETIEALYNLGIERVVAIYGATETGGVGYRTDPEAPYRLFDHWQWHDEQLWRTHTDARETTPFTPQDTLRFIDERHFHPLGRRDGVVQVAGTNVHPDAVAARLNEHPLVADCTVRLDRSDEPRLTARVVLTPGTAPNDAEAELRRWIRSNLRTPERPAVLSFVDRLPRSAMGKPLGRRETA